MKVMQLLITSAARKTPVHEMPNIMNSSFALSSSGTINSNSGLLILADYSNTWI